jgi:chromosome segregation ATPase
MKTTIRNLTLPTVLALLLTPVAGFPADTSAEAAAVKAKIEALRAESTQARHQVNLTREELLRLTQKNVDLRAQFEKFKAELVTMEQKALWARERADSMRAKGQAFFSDWEQQIQSIQNPDIRTAAEKRLAKRKKSYEKILSTMQEAKAQLVPFMSDLNDIKKLFDGELTASSVASAKNLIRQAGWHGEDVVESLQDVEKELDRVAAELGKYQ